MPNPLASLTCLPGRSASTVLVLDASAALGLSIIRSLRRYGVHAVLATSGAQALQNCKAHNVGAVVVHDDARGGRHHLADLQRVHPRLPLAMVGSDHETCAAEEPGAQRKVFFSKPLEITELLEQLNDWIKPKRPHPAAAATGQPPTGQLPAEAWASPILDADSRPTRKLAASEDADPGRAATTQVPKPDERVHEQAAKTAEFHRISMAGSYSIVNRRRDTLQFAAARP